VAVALFREWAPHAAASVTPTLIRHCTEVVIAGEPFKKKCLKDPTVPEYKVNVYYCYEESKAECCVEDMQYTCCETRQSFLLYVCSAVHCGPGSFIRGVFNGRVNDYNQGLAVQ